MVRSHDIASGNGCSMKFSNLKFYTFTADFKTPVRTVKTEMIERKVLVVSLDVDGSTFFAESNAFETDWYHYETIESVHESVQRLFDKIQSAAWEDYATLGAVLAPYRSMPHAMALFDYIGWQSLNRRGPVTVPLGFTLHPGQEVVPQNRVKLKWSDDIVARVKEVREQYPAIRIAVDANGSLTAQDIPLLEDCMEYGVDYFEEPFSDFKLYSENRHLPLAIDESASSIDNIIKYYGAGVKTVIAKYARLGGGYPLLAIKEAIPDLRVVAGGMYEYGLSKYFTAALAGECGTIPDVTPRGTYFEEDYASYDEKIVDGKLTMTFPEVDISRLQELN